MEHKTKRIAVRIHSSGDFFSREYISFWKDIILKNEKVLHACADLLLEKEKIGRDEFEALFA